MALSLKHASSYSTSFLLITDKGGVLCYSCLILSGAFVFTIMWLSRSLHHWGA